MMPRKPKPKQPEAEAKADDELTAFLRHAIASKGVPADLARNRLLRPVAAAAYLGLCRNMLWHWRRYGGGPAYVRLGPAHAVGYAVADLDAWIAERRVAPRPFRGRPPKKT